MARRARAKDRLAPLLGRSKELDHLKDALHVAASGKGRVEVVSGEAGIGKTRLLEELSSYAESCRISVFSACCPDDSGSPPYWPWSQILSSLVVGMKQSVLSDILGSSASLVEEAFPSVKAGIPRAPRIPSGSDTAESARFRLFDAVARLLAARSCEGALILVMDDLHWADEPSLKLLVHVCAEIPRLPILLLGAYRDLGFEPGHPLPVAVGALTRQLCFSRVALHGLSESDATELLVDGIGKAAALPLAQTIFRLTDGNPLFITQVIRLLVDDPSASTAPGGLAAGVRDVIARRLSRLSSACSEVITLASVLGSEFAATVVAEIIDPRLGLDVAAAIDEAVKERILEETGDGPDRYRFSHVLIRDAVLAGLQPGRRVRLHARVLEIMERRWGGDSAAHASELLVHALQGQPVLGPEAPARYALYAGETALRAHAFEDARKHFATGLSALQDRPMDDLKAELTLGSAKARCVLDMGHESRVLYQRCFEYYEARDDTAKMVEVLTYHFVLPEPVLLPLYERTLRRVAQDSRDRGHLLSSYAFIRAWSSRTGPEGTPEFLEALRLARLHADEWLEMRVLWLSAFVDRFRAESRFDERQAHLVKAEEIARRLGDFADEMWIRFLLQRELLHRGRVDEAAVLARRMSETAERQRDLTDRLRARSAELDIAWHRAEWGRVRELCSDLLERAPPLYREDGYYMALRCEAAYEVGDFASGRQDLLRLIETTRGVPRVPAEIYLTCARAITSVSNVTGDRSLLGEAQAFARLILEIPDINEGKERDAHWILGRICVLRGDAEGAAAEYEYLAQQLARTPVEDRPFSDAHELLGSLAAVRGELDRAAAHYEDALLVAGNTVAESAWIEYDFSRVLTRRHATGDSARSRSLLDRCLETAETATLVPLAERAREALASLGSGSKAHLDGLTDRETEVLALMARGLTNKEIGAKLFISVKTVDAHVRNILEKTGTANRTEAAAYAIWHDLPGV